MKLRMMIGILILAGGFASSRVYAQAKATTGTNASAVTPNSSSPTPKPDDSYSYGNELMKQILLSIRKDQFDFRINFDVSMNVDPEKNAPSTVHDFDMLLVMQFEKREGGINLPISAPDPAATEQDKRFAIHHRIDLSDKYGIIRLQKGTRVGEYEGNLTFYKRDPVSHKLVQDPVKLELNNDLLDLKRMYLSGAKLKFQLPGPNATPEQTKRGLVSALMTCDAAEDSLDLKKGVYFREKLKTCGFTFEGDQLRIQFWHRDDFEVN